MAVPKDTTGIINLNVTCTLTPVFLLFETSLIDVIEIQH